jgi:hypothetical protein
MRLIIYYVALVLAADVVAVILCLWIERFWLAGSMPIFIGLYFVILWGAWVAAVRLTEPKPELVTVAAAHRQPAE